MSCKSNFVSKILKTKFEISDLSPLAQSTILVNHNNCNILVNLCAKNLLDEECQGQTIEDFNFQQQTMRSTTGPLTVNFLSRFESINKIHTSRFRRETRPSEYETLVSRKIDRSLRPLMPKLTDWSLEITCDVLSGGNTKQEIQKLPLMAMNGSSLAMQLSFDHLDGCVASIDSIDYEDGNKFDLSVSTNQKGNILMLEGHAIQRSDMNHANFIKIIQNASNDCKQICDRFLKFSDDYKRNILTSKLDNHNQNHVKLIDSLSKETLESIETLKDWIRSQFHVNYMECDKMLFGSSLKKSEFSKKSSDLKSKIFNRFFEDFKSKERFVNRIYRFFDIIYQEEFNKLFQNYILDESNKSKRNNDNKMKIRIDGRSIDEIRPLKSLPLVFDSLHGSAIFSRGLTNVLSNVTLAPQQFKMPNDSISDIYCNPDHDGKSFFLFYNFPAYCNGEINERGSVSGPKRREIGHANLAYNALKSSIDNEYLKKYCIAANCKVLSSNGSSSMATICATNLALRTAQVPMLDHVSGIAMGFVSNQENDRKSYQQNIILTDITGIEDALGHTDCKVASTQNSMITAIQTDCKLIDGLNIHEISSIISKALIGNRKIIENMKLNLNSKMMSRFIEKHEENVLPIVKIIEIVKSVRFGYLSVKFLKKLEYELNTFCEIIDDDNNNDDDDDDIMKLRIFSNTPDEMTKAIKLINQEFSDIPSNILENGAIYQSCITDITDNGIYAKIDSNIEPFFVSRSQLNVTLDSLQIGSNIAIKYIGKDPINGRHIFSHRSIFISSTLMPSIFTSKILTDQNMTQ